MKIWRDVGEFKLRMVFSKKKILTAAGSAVVVLHEARGTKHSVAGSVEATRGICLTTARYRASWGSCGR